MARPKAPKLNDSKINRSIYEDIIPRELSKADRRRIDILEAAIKTYASLSLDYVSYEDIARTAKINRPLINHYFPEKRELFVKTMKFVRAKFQEFAVNALQKHSSPKDQLRAYIESTFDWLKAYPFDVKAWIFFYYICANDKKLRVMHRGLTSIGSERLVALLERGVEVKQFSISNTQETAKNIQRIITGSLFEVTTEYESYENKEFKQTLDETLSLCFKICGAKDPL